MYYTYMHVHEDTHTSYVVFPNVAATYLSVKERSLITNLYRKKAADPQVQEARTREYLAFSPFFTSGNDISHMRYVQG